MSKLDDISKKLDQLPQAILKAKFPLQGMHAGGTSDLATKGGYEAHNFTQTHQAIAALAGKLDGYTKAVEQLATGSSVDPEAVRAAAEAGVAAALSTLEADVRLTVGTEG